MAIGEIGSSETEKRLKGHSLMFHIKGGGMLSTIQIRHAVDLNQGTGQSKIHLPPESALKDTLYQTFRRPREWSKNHLTPTGVIFKGAIASEIDHIAD